jgi:hypothetical protein
MTQIRVERPKRRDRRADSEFLPRDPRDPDIVRAKALGRAEGRGESGRATTPGR